MDLSNRNSTILLLSVLMIGCFQFRSKPTNKMFIQENFTESQIEEVRDALTSWFDTALHYNVTIGDLKYGSWDLIDPIFMRSDNKRAIGLLLSWDEEATSKLNSLTWICGFMYEDSWHFYRPNDTQYINKKISAKSYDPYKDKNNLSAIKGYTKGYLKYDKLKGKWAINDRWFRGFMDNSSKLDLKDRYLTDEQILALPDEYWEERYLLNVKLRNRFLKLIKDKWTDENSKNKRGEYSPEEWSEIMRMRQAETYEDWVILSQSRRDLLRDPIIMELDDKIMKRIGQGKYFKK